MFGVIFKILKLSLFLLISAVFFPLVAFVFFTHPYWEEWSEEVFKF